MIRFFRITGDIIIGQKVQTISLIITMFILKIAFSKHISKYLYIFIRVILRRTPCTFKGLVESFVTDKPDIILNPTQSRPLPVSIWKKTINSKDLGSIIIAQCVAFFEMATIAARTYPGQLPMFSYIHCFSSVVWALIGISIIILSLISTQQTLKLIDFYEFLWNYSNILFNKTFQKFITHLKRKYFLGVWIISVLFLSIHFTAYLLDFMALTQPMVKIDNLE